MSVPDLIGFLKSAYPNGSWPRPFHVLEGLQRIAAGETPKDAAKAVGTSLYFLEQAQKSRRPEFDILGVRPGDLTGSTFRRAAEMVGLEPDDCFPLATYKIFGALQKQEKEHLPYIFAIVGVPNLTAASIQDLLPADEIQIVALFSKSDRVSGKRNIEDKVIERIVAQKSTSFTEVYNRIRLADWYVLSARKADKLLRSLLFERVFAMKVRGFAQQFRGAELDMHFSLKNDLVTFKDFLQTLKREGQTKMASLLERGTL